MMADMTLLTELTAGMPILYGGNRITRVTPSLAAAFQPGDRLIVVDSSGDLLHIPAAEHAIAAKAVGQATCAFTELRAISDDIITNFYDAFALKLACDEDWALILQANEIDIAQAKTRGRSTTRLQANDKMRQDMIAGLHEWRDTAACRNTIIETVTHQGWQIEQVGAPLGVIGFVFEGRPNVFADATGVLRSGNTVVFRIGSDALGTARAILQYALNPALRSTGMPEGAVVLVESAAHAAGWALFSDHRLALAVARGSGRATALLGSVARQSGVPVSLHGTGGAWIVADSSADAERFAAAIYHSLDRKVCNTLNTCCIPRSRVADLIPRFLQALCMAGERRGQSYKLHVVAGDEDFIPADLFSTSISVRRAAGDIIEPQAESLAVDTLGHEWEWEETPEVSLKIVADNQEAITLFNQYSPQFIVSLIAEDQQAADSFYQLVNAPFFGNGFTRWVDGQYALCRPELGLTNWENGRLFARGGILSGDGVFTIRTKVVQEDPNIHR